MKSIALLLGNIPRRLKSTILYLPPHLIPLLTNPDCILPQLYPKGLLNHQYCGKGVNVYLVKKPIEPPVLLKNSNLFNFNDLFKLPE